MISTLGLGSCLGITAYDAITRTGGLLHAMLPDSNKHHSPNPHPPMYLDLGVPALLAAMRAAGAEPRRLEFKIFGGAQILDSSEYFSIGRQNIEMMKQLVLRHNLRVSGWDVAGQVNRSIELYLDTGRVLLRLPARQHEWV
ncbi:chemotaxis protein CheD [Opitutus sp. ER46]|uniref:chemotaxis protein CheD n=1 Tax=Opitutus sp. ER46 TaxID=2161864 RepID=UPI001304FCAD|nr:chemotaxis protein CheD [Opitutus sp. ER46]